MWRVRAPDAMALLRTPAARPPVDPPAWLLAHPASASTAPTATAIRRTDTRGRRMRKTVAAGRPFVRESARVTASGGPTAPVRARAWETRPLGWIATRGRP